MEGRYLITRKFWKFESYLVYIRLKNVPQVLKVSLPLGSDYPSEQCVDGI